MIINQNQKEEKKFKKILSKKTIVRVRGGVSGVWSKTILSRFLILEPFPSKHCIMVAKAI